MCVVENQGCRKMKFLVQEVLLVNANKSVEKIFFFTLFKKILDGKLCFTCTTSFRKIKKYFENSSNNQFTQKVI